MFTINVAVSFFDFYTTNTSENDSFRINWGLIGVNVHVCGCGASTSFEGELGSFLQDMKDWKM